MPGIRSSNAAAGPRRVNPDRMRRRVTTLAPADPEPPAELVEVRDAVGRLIRTLPARRAH